MLEHRRAFATPSLGSRSSTLRAAGTRAWGRRRPPFVMRQHHVATPSSPKPLLRLLSAQPFLRQAPGAADDGILAPEDAGRRRDRDVVAPYSRGSASQPDRDERRDSPASLPIDRPQRRRRRRRGQCHRLRRPGPRPQHRRRLRRPARPGLRRLLRHRRLYLRHPVVVAGAAAVVGVLGAVPVAGLRRPLPCRWRARRGAFHRFVLDRDADLRGASPPSSACYSGRPPCGCAAIISPSSPWASARSCPSSRATRPI